ncbi:uncharacterized protein [Elaeis guineensis]|uniref:Uncharacterized protein LOC105050784 n=1 Tax=Elaeis guineensis var. tenera TaxID=51953 RepID=A0A6I9RML1_ELAGV|nr:uncharacterized protein LOC105050784 [Elaeis guineensis]
MCNQGLGRHQSEIPSSATAADFSPIPGEMESATVTASATAAPDEPLRVKFLCSFGGSILPRPLDGRLRYVGGETRIVTVPRDISYEDFLARMRELFEGVVVIKYQQPDEDLDALVSVVNDDDVMNMMEEYDKLGATGDGFTRLRIFLFSQHPDQDAASIVHFDADERETERRYVDALNSLSDTRSPSPPDISEQFFGPPSIEGGIHNQLSLHHLKIPHPSHGQWNGEVDSPWSPAYFSPGCHDPREFPPSPSSARFHFGPGEFSERISDEFVRQSPGHQLHQYDRQSPHSMENVVWLPPGAIVQEKAGFPSNLGHSHNVVEGSSICEHCRMAFKRNQGSVSDARYLDPRWKHGQPHMEQSNMGNEYVGHFSNSCAECYHGKEAYMLNQDVKLDQGRYVQEQNDHNRPFYNEPHGQDRGYVLHHHQVNHRLEDPRVHLSGTGRLSEHYVVDGNVMNVPFVHGNVYNEHTVPPNCISHDDTHHLRPGTELGNGVFHVQQTVGGGAHTHILGFEDSAVRYGNHPPYGADSLYQVPKNLAPIQSLRRKVHPPVRPGTSFESPGLMMPNGGINSGFIRGTQDGSPRYPYVGVDDQVQSPWSMQNDAKQQRMYGFDGSAAPEYLYHHVSRISLAPDSIQGPPGMLHMESPSKAIPLVPTSSCPVNGKLVASSASDYHHCPSMGSDVIERMQVLEDKNQIVEVYETKPAETTKQPGAETVKERDEHLNSSPNNKQKLEFDSNELKPTEEEHHTVRVGNADASDENGNISEEKLIFLPEMMASVKRLYLEGVVEVAAKAHEDADANIKSIPSKNDSSSHELASGNANADLETESDGDSENQKTSKIEPTTAEAEAVARGLQTIKNDDLEEIRELGSGTYGAVYHGKWKGSDVAIKRIKASCFAGRPSERERLIADFWKEALILSSLHHPNVVSFYGVVRDGPDGSLATVTEFMVNGSLKQFLQKKDRTIDRRKRLIIAMDVAFGMEYLHGKNIVHFDLKCENLLVNMRDPQRPVCKIGDLGLSKVKQHTLVSGGVRGTLPWMAPELLSGKSHMVSEKIDVYSFGIVMWELLTGEEPYANMHCASIIGGIVNNTLRPQIPTWCDPEWKTLMESCWSSDPAERPSFSEISQKLRKMAAAINVK